MKYQGQSPGAVRKPKSCELPNKNIMTWGIQPTGDIVSGLLEQDHGNFVACN